MTDIDKSSSVKRKLAVFHNLPSGGGINAAASMIRGISDRFSITVHSPGGSSLFSVPGLIQTREWPFPSSSRITGIRRFAAPFLLSARLRAFDRLCRKIADEINRTADLALVFNSMYVAAPPLLQYLEVPSLYFCYEYPRHLYEPDLVRRTSNRIYHLLLRHLRKIERIKDRKAVLSADKVVTLSSWMKKRLRDIYGIESLIVRPGIDTEFFRADKITGKSNMVLSVGALWPFKGHEMAIETIAEIDADIRPSLTIVADRKYPGYEQKLEQLAAKLGVVLNIMKNISNEDLRDTYRTSMAVLCCQHNEPYGLVLLEAMSCGIPVIAVKEGGFLDNIKNGENGIFVNRDPVEMAAALNDVLSDGVLREKLSTGGRYFAITKRSSAEAAASLAKILNNN